MAKKRANMHAGISESQQKTQNPLSAPGFFPFARYTSVVGVHTTLLTFTALYLPRTTFLFEFAKPALDPASQTSRDRPQHPFLQELTISPVSTLICLCAGVFLLQGWWGGWLRDWFIEYSLRGSDEQKRSDKVAANNERATACRFTVTIPSWLPHTQTDIQKLLTAWGTTFAASLVLYTILVLFGAPLTSHVPQTYLLALLLSLLIVFPPAYSLGRPYFSGNDSHVLVNRLTWVRLFAEIRLHTPVERAFVYPAIGTVLGCWVGVIPTALDWDRPWQAWPLTPAYAAILGYVISSLLALTASAILYLADEHIRSLDQQREKKSN